MDCEKHNYLSKRMVFLKHQFSTLINLELFQIREIHWLMHPILLTMIRALKCTFVMFWCFIFMVIYRACITLPILSTFWILFTSLLFQCTILLKIKERLLQKRFALKSLWIISNIPRINLGIRSCGQHSNVCHVSSLHHLKVLRFLWIYHVLT